jgi:hypothetical protein
VGAVFRIYAGPNPDYRTSASTEVCTSSITTWNTLILLFVERQSYNMLLKFVQVACGLSLFSFSLAQDRFFSETPIAEEEALSHIIEDKPGDLANKKKDWISPEYSLIYRQALPIPPVKQPKQ